LHDGSYFIGIIVRGFEDKRQKMNPLGFRVNELISQKERELAITPIVF